MFSIEIQGTAFFELLFNGSHMKLMRELTSKGVTEQVKLWYRTLPDSYFDNPSPFPDGTSRRRGGRTFVPPLADAWSYNLQGSSEFSVEFKHPRAHGVPWGLRLHHKGIENMRPVNALALTIPVTNEAVKRRARDFPHKLFMVTKHAMGEKIGSLCWADDVGKVHAAYVLMKSVRIPSLQERKGLPAIPKDEELRGFMEEQAAKAFNTVKAELLWRQTQRLR